MAHTDIYGLDSKTHEWVLIETVLGTPDRLASAQAVVSARMDGWEEVKTQVRWS